MSFGLGTFYICTALRVAACWCYGCSLKFEFCFCVGGLLAAALWCILVCFPLIAPVVAVDIRGASFFGCHDFLRQSF